jgi:hypothetical protein
MNLFRVMKHKKYVSTYLFRIKLKTINISLTASRKGGLTDTDIKIIDNNAMLIRKYERRNKLLKY